MGRGPRIPIEWGEKTDRQTQREKDRDKGTKRDGRDVHKIIYITKEDKYDPLLSLD